VLAIELLASAHALDCLSPLKTTVELQAVHTQVRERVPYRPADHRLDLDIAQVAQLVESGALSAHLPTAPG